jgi:hypothetical protein
MGFWDRKRQEREWGVEFKNVPTPELRRKMEGALYPSPDKQRFVEGLLRRRENPYTAKTIIPIVVGIISAIGVVIGIISAIWWTK